MQKWIGILVCWINLVACQNAPSQAMNCESAGDSPSEDPHQLIIDYNSLSAGPILGAITDRSVKVWVRAHDTQAEMRLYTLEIASAKDPDKLVFSASQQIYKSIDDFTGTIQALGLAPHTEYIYYVRLDDTEVATGSFHTLAEDGDAAKFRFAVGADLWLGDESNSNHRSRCFAPRFANIWNEQPDFMMLLGDQIYADHEPVLANDLDAYRARYRFSFGEFMTPEYLEPPSVFTIRDFMAQVPMFMIWDDHEIFNDFYPGKPGVYERYATARQAYLEYQHAHNPAGRFVDFSHLDDPEKHTLYYNFAIGDVGFYVLDTRSHRASNYALTWDENGQAKSMLGQTQFQDLLAWLSEHDEQYVFKIIVSSVPWHRWSTTHRDSWAGEYDSSGTQLEDASNFKGERDLLFAAIREREISGVVLLSGDQHWPGVFELNHSEGYPFVEFMPTPLAVTNRKPPQGSVEGQIVDGERLGCLVTDTLVAGQDNLQVFGLFEIDTSLADPALHFTMVNALNPEKRYCETTLLASQLE